MTPSTPTIIVIDDEVILGRFLQRITEATFPTCRVLWARNGVAGLDMVREHAQHVRLVVLDLNMPLMDGNLTAAQIRLLAPHVPILPCTSHLESLPALEEMGCLPPIIKGEGLSHVLPDRMRAALFTRVGPAPNGAWMAALRMSGDRVLAFVQQGTIAGVLAADREAAERVRRALALIETYCGRYATPAREVTHARKLLREAGIG